MRSPARNGTRLAPGDGRIALALHQAQSARVSDTGPQQIKGLDEIVAMAERTGWSQAFKTMKALGLLAEQTLGQVMARWGHAGAAPSMAKPRESVLAAPSLAPSRIGWR